jgi:hypothetical protein
VLVVRISISKIIVIDIYRLDMIVIADANGEGITFRLISQPTLGIGGEACYDKRYNNMSNKFIERRPYEIETCPVAIILMRACC